MLTLSNQKEFKEPNFIPQLTRKIITNKIPSEQKNGKNKGQSRNN